MRFWRWIGHSGISAVIAEQFGTAMIPRWSRMRPALISGITSGTFGSMRKAEELSMTTAPAFNSSMVISSPRKESLRPADRALASAFSLPTRKPRLSMVAMNSRPTAPVTPAMATTGSSVTLVSLRDASGNKKAPDLHQAGLRLGTAAVKLLCAHDSRSPRGLSGFGRGFRRSHHGAGTYGPAAGPSTAFAAHFALNEVATDAGVTR